MTLYEKIDFLCDTNKIARKELARQTGISYATLNSMFSRQSTNISLETIRAIANFFNVSLDYLLADEVDESTEKGELINVGGNSTASRTEILKKISKMSDAEINATLAFVKTLESFNRNSTDEPII